MITDDRPFPMSNSSEPERRKKMLSEPRMEKLAAYTAKLRKEGYDGKKVEVPEFDPLDGGADAKALFLLEKPGRMTSVEGKKIGSGFISRDNDDLTAKAIFDFMEQAKLDRKLTALWNVVPWWDQTRKINTKQLKAGVAEVRRLVKLFSNLEAIVLVGGKAGKAKPLLLLDSNIELFISDHPSPIVRATRRERWEAIGGKWAEVKRFLER